MSELPIEGIFRTKGAAFYKTLPKTPLPTPEQLGTGELGAAHAVEYHQNACACGVRLSFHSFRISRAIAGLDGAARTRAMMDYLDQHNFRMCCRNHLISPLVCTVTSADIGALYVEPAVATEIGTSTSNAPSAIVRSSNMYPPLVLYSSKRPSE